MESVGSKAIKDAAFVLVAGYEVRHVPRTPLLLRALSFCSHPLLLLVLLLLVLLPLLLLLPRMLVAYQLFSTTVCADEDATRGLGERLGYKGIKVSLPLYIIERERWWRH